MNPYAPPTAPSASIVPSIDPARAAELRRTLKGYNGMSFALGLPGLVLQGVGRSMEGPLGTLLTLAGVGLFVGGLWFYAKMRGQHPAFCILGIFSCIGMLVLYFLPKKCLNCAAGASYAVKECRTCGAPLGS